MKKFILFSIVSLFVGQISAQTEIELSKKYTTVLIFPSEIDGDPIIGNDSEFLIIPTKSQTAISKRTLKMEYNLDANEKSNTNLLVFTVDGYSYEYILKYKDIPSTLVHYVKPKEAANNITKNYSKTTEKKSHNENSVNEIIPTNHIADEELLQVKTLCEKTQYIKKKLMGIFNKSYSVKLSLKRVSYDKDKLYLHLLFQNKGVQAYDVEFINYLKGTSNDESSIKQDPDIKPYFTFKEPKRVKGKSDLHFVVVFNSITINENKELVIKIKELNGERNISLTIEDEIINNPLKL